MPDSVLAASKAKPFTGGPSFTIRNRIYRLCWCVTWILFARWTPVPAHAWRRWLLRLFGARIESSAAVYPTARIWSPANLQVGEFACIGPGVTVYSMAKTTFGPYAVASQGAHICCGTHDIEDEHFQLTAFPITIGARAWIAADAFVGPGVNVGDGAILGARGCAFKDLEPWTVYVGNPARPIKLRNIRFVDCSASQA